MEDYQLLYFLVFVIGIGTSMLVFVKNKAKVLYCILTTLLLLSAVRIAETSNDIDKLNSNNKQYISSNKNLREEIKSLKEKNEELNDNMEFYNAHIVFINSGINVYHRLDCTDFDNSNFVAYNSSTAVAQGYKPCSKCNAPIVDKVEKTYIVYITRSGSKYHTSNCSYLKSSIAISKIDAISQGYTACSRCNP